jgi:hypothetical protein
MTVPKKLAWLFMVLSLILVWVLIACHVIGLLSGWESLEVFLIFGAASLLMSAYLIWLKAVKGK